MDPFESLEKPMDPFSEKCIYMHKIEIDVLKLTNIFGVLEAINYFVAYSHY
jgi:hypothetical protein